MQKDDSDIFKNHSASFRDPSGFIFQYDGEIYRQVNSIYRDSYLQLINSGLYNYLVNNEMILPHSEVDGPIADNNNAWRILKPTQLNFISYPYEWCFSQLKDAALLTLGIQRIALKHDMCLKDASSYNIQFHNGRPIFIDTLSFEPYVEGQPWIAYRQFCQHFLAPLALMSKCDIRLGQLMRVYIDGIPLDLTSRLLPKTSRMNLGLMIHIILHARTQKTFSDSHKEASTTIKSLSKVSRYGMIGLIDGLYKTIKKLHWKPGNTEWGDYYNDTNYSENSIESKKNLIKTFIDNLNPQSKVWDIGANTGLFSRFVSEKGHSTIAFDIDPTAVELNYHQVKNLNDKTLLPLILDLNNPSPGLGWNNTERESLLSRGPVDCVMALALIHHLAISNNVPLDNLAKFFSLICRKILILEFVPKSDSQVQRLLRSREDIFTDYNQDHFEQDFELFFTIVRKEPIVDSERHLYLMNRK